MIQRPRSFRFEPGDYIYLNIPAIAAYEWHPFSISSAPEQQGVWGTPNWGSSLASPGCPASHKHPTTVPPPMLWCGGAVLCSSP